MREVKWGKGFAAEKLIAFLEFEAPIRTRDVIVLDEQATFFKTPLH
jgi:hypothetical protein